MKFTRLCLVIKVEKKQSWLKMAKLKVDGGGINGNRLLFYAYKLLSWLMTLLVKRFKITAFEELYSVTLDKLLNYFLPHVSLL